MRSLRFPCVCRQLFLPRYQIQFCSKTRQGSRPAASKRVAPPAYQPVRMASDLTAAQTSRAAAPTDKPFAKQVKGEPSVKLSTEQAQGTKSAPTSSIDQATAKMASTTLTPSTAPTLPTHSQSFPNCYPDCNPVDTYRAYISTELAKLAGVEATTIYPLLSWTAKLENGDLSLPVPALRLKGPKPAELAEKWAKEVGP